MASCSVQLLLRKEQKGGDPRNDQAIKGTTRTPGWHPEEKEAPTAKKRRYSRTGVGGVTENPNFCGGPARHLVRPVSSHDASSRFSPIKAPQGSILGSGFWYVRTLGVFWVWSKLKISYVWRSIGFRLRPSGPRESGGPTWVSPFIASEPSGVQVHTAGDLKAFAQAGVRVLCRPSPINMDTSFYVVSHVHRLCLRVHELDDNFRKEKAWHRG